MVNIANSISVSGGKDSTAMALLAIERGEPNLHFVFADTGHEHELTYQHVEYLDGKFRELCGRGIDRVRADFTDMFDGRRERLTKKWIEMGMPEERIKEMQEAMQPTGIPFLDASLLHTIFPSSNRRFCTKELKKDPIQKYENHLWEQGNTVISWQGVRRDESKARSQLSEKDVEVGTWEPEPKGILIYRPILDWTAQQCFEISKRFGIEPNPLYKLGLKRVGCMPCVYAVKDEMAAIAKRFPEVIDRVEQWENLVRKVFHQDVAMIKRPEIVANYIGDHNWKQETHGIRAYAEWATSARGQKQWERDLEKEAAEREELPLCQSLYGLCE